MKSNHKGAGTVAIYVRQRHGKPVYQLIRQVGASGMTALRGRAAALLNPAVIDALKAAKFTPRQVGVS